MKLSKKELEWVRTNLISRRMYRHTNVPLRATVWEPWMEVFFKKINDELDLL
jgi:hypothetical protein